jgi:fermentation-respiration switch protein FrsA (DUF1100 family)
MFSAIETRMLFFPTRASEDWLAPEEVGLHAEDVELRGLGGVRLHAWWCPGRPAIDPKAEGALLYCHGNAGNLSHRAHPILEIHRMLGLPVFIFDYPGYGRSEGRPSEKGCYAAAHAACDWLAREKGVDASRLILFGESLGGGMAVELATRAHYRAAVLCRTFTSIPDMAQVQFPYLPLRWLVRNRFDNLAKIDRCSTPMFIAHGDCDSLIPYRQAQRLFEKAREPKRFFHMAGCDHVDPLRPAFYQALRDFLNETAPASTSAPSRTSST